MNKKLIFSLFVILFGSLITIMIVSADRENETTVGNILIASVKNSKLTDHGLSYMISNPEVDKYRLKILAEDWVNREILAQVAEQKDIVDSEMLNNNLQNYKRELLANSYLEHRYRQIPLVTDAEILSFYNDNIESFIRDKRQIRAYHYLFANKESAMDLKNALLTSNEEKMANLLNRFHGTLRTFSRDDVIEEISSAAFGSRSNLVGPIETEYGYHLLQIIDRFEEESLIPAHEVRDEIIQKIKVKKQNILYYQIIDSLRLSTGYYINESYFE
ncbi:MAG: peptidyl-prolyl cis-trans isomerase [Candidatus Marinimicrobia bacterium]|nr:peptidyl-prolyl cis-trans isomerase [Candidatus Neomarinimicrobiota bacterium]TFB10365.1 peptidyl-prolyl cis-trans isomerase [Candidatus Marinimicrobia bacterium MT.SAG.2]